MILIYITAGWLAGIWFAANWPDVPRSVWGGGALAAGILALWIQQQAAPRSTGRYLALLLVVIAATCAGGLRQQLAQPVLDEGHVAAFNDGRSEVTLTGRVVAEPDIADRNIRLQVEAETIAVGDGETQEVTGRVLVNAPRFAGAPYGSRVAVRGQLETPESTGDFDYRAYLARQGIFSHMRWSQVEVLAEGEGNPLYSAIFAFKGRAQDSIDRHVPYPEAGLLSGILLGNDTVISRDIEEAFQVTGMTHIIAISGFNIALLSGLLVRFSEPLAGRRGALWITLGGIVLYTLLVGADASVVRAAIMGGIYLLGGRYLGRPVYALASLALAALVMTLLRPAILWEAGFQLSFMATLSLLLYAEPISRYAREWLQQRAGRELTRRLLPLLADTVLVTLAAQVLTLPLTIVLFGRLSLVNLPANLLILPAQPGVMIWGGLATIVGMVWAPAGELLGWVAWLFLHYSIEVNQALAGLSGAAIPVELSVPGLLLAYALIFGLTWLARQEWPHLPELAGRLPALFNTQHALAGTLILLLLSWQWTSSLPDGYLHVAFLNVGQGDAIFIQTPAGRQILVDGGRYPDLLKTRLGQQMPFWDRTLDLAIATHPDEDHVGGLTALFERYQVERLLTNGLTDESATAYNLVLEAAGAAGTHIHPAVAGEIYDLGDGVRLEVLHPDSDPLNSDNRNDHSVAVRLVYGHFTLLLTGDAEVAGEQAIVQRGLPVEALVFKAGHHGANNASNDFFLDAVQPQYIVVSAGADNRFGHPAEGMLQRAAAIGATVLRTDERGTIEITTDGRQMWWQAYPQQAVP